jgi:hypothetical protein
MKRLLFLPLLIAVTACSTTAGSKSASPRDRSTLTREDIQTSGAVDAFTAVQTLRPHWLMKRGTTTLNQSEFIKIYLDGNLMGGPEHLRQISTHSIESIRYMDALDATQRYGLDHGQGAVLVYTKKGT